MNRRALTFAAVALAVVGGWMTFTVRAHLDFPSDRTPEGAYARIVLAVSEAHPADCFAFQETEAQWAAFTIHDFRAKASAKVASSYPEPERSRLLAAYAPEADAADGAGVWVHLAEERGWIGRLRKDLSGIARLEVNGERATIETARGTRYAFRRRENGIWGMTLFTGELLAEAEKAARDFEVVSRAADDYARAAKDP